MRMLDDVRTMLWINRKRIGVGKMPILRMPANRHHAQLNRTTEEMAEASGVRDAGLRAFTCPVAKALNGVVTTRQIKMKVNGEWRDLGKPPEFVSRSFNRQDDAFEKMHEPIILKMDDTKEMVRVSTCSGSGREL